MNYKMNDAEFEVEHKFLDTTVNILNFSELGASLTISRGYLDKDETIETYFEKQINQLKSEMQNFILGEKREVVFGINNDLQGVEVYSGFMSAGRKIDQVFIVHADEKKVLVLTYSQLRVFTKEDLNHWEQIKSTFNFN